MSTLSKKVLHSYIPVHRCLIWLASTPLCWQESPDQRLSTLMKLIQVLFLISKYRPLSLLFAPAINILFICKPYYKPITPVLIVTKLCLHTPELLISSILTFNANSNSTLHYFISKSQMQHQHYFTSLFITSRIFITTQSLLRHNHFTSFPLHPKKPRKPE